MVAEVMTAISQNNTDCGTSSGITNTSDLWPPR